MFRTLICIATLSGATVLIGCGTSTPDSRAEVATGVSPSGYPKGSPKDSGSPALASSTESQYSREQAEKTEGTAAARSTK
ncbi:MAG: hypothetical protein M3N93_08825 [Acidobacteriota bacterium]|nr:hypothetical protein [Acidobacteriota bacterium]